MDGGRKNRWKSADKYARECSRVRGRERSVHQRRKRKREEGAKYGGEISLSLSLSESRGKRKEKCAREASVCVSGTPVRDMMKGKREGKREGERESGRTRHMLPRKTGEDLLSRERAALEQRGRGRGRGRERGKESIRPEGKNGPRLAHLSRSESNGCSRRVERANAEAANRAAPVQPYGNGFLPGPCFLSFFPSLSIAFPFVLPLPLVACVSRLPQTRKSLAETPLSPAAAADARVVCFSFLSPSFLPSSAPLVPPDPLAI